MKMQVKILIYLPTSSWGLIIVMGKEGRVLRINKEADSFARHDLNLEIYLELGIKFIGR